MRRVLVVALLLLSVPAVAEENPHLARARSELNDLKYDKARDSLDQALKYGKSSPAEMAEIYRLSGEVAAALGDPKKAQDYFTRLLTVDPTAKLAAGSSPKIAAPFNAAVKSGQGKPIKIHQESTPGDPPKITLVVDADPLGLVKGARAMYKAGANEDATEELGGPRIELTLPRATRVEVVLAALDEHGNRVAEIGRDKPIVIESGTGGGEVTPPFVEPPVETPSGGSKPFYTRWYLYGGIAVGFLGAGTYFGLKAKSAEDDVDKLNQESMAMPFTHDFTEAKDIEDRARSNALLANISFAAGGAFAIVATILFIRDMGHKDTPEATAIAPVPLPGGAGIGLTTTF